MRAIAWIDRPQPQGSWGRPGDLSIPIDDRGLLLADGVFETVLVLAGKPQRLEEHLERWRQGASLLGMAPPPQLDAVSAVVDGAVDRSGITSGALRLNWSRGTSGRGIEIASSAETQNHRFWLQLTAHTPAFNPVRVIVSPTEVRSATSLLSRCKTFAYGASIQARRQARCGGADDALIRSSSGELCCATTANLLVLSPSGWITPPRSSGCLPGVMRQRALDLGLVRERTIHQQDLLASAGALLLNSLNCRAISHLDDQALPFPQPPKGCAENFSAAFWHQLLNE